MTDNLIDILKGYVTPDVISKASNMLGESEGGISKAISAAIPTILGGLVHKSNDSSTMSNVMSLINSTSDSGNIAENLPSMLTGSGSGLVDSLFGSRKDEVANTIARTSGLKTSSVLSILGMVSTFVMSYFAKSGLSLSGLTDMLSSQKANIMAAVPSGLNLGFANPIGKVTDHTSHYVHDAKPTGMPKWLLPLLLVLAAIVAIYYFSRSCGNKEVEQTVVAEPIDTMAVEPIDTMKVNANLGKFFKFKLPNGVELNAPEFGIENKLHTWLMDKTKKVDTVTWFNFDRLLFDTSKTTLRPESQEQLKNMVEILKAYPTVDLKIGGYTDNVGDPAANMKLSDERAKSVMKEMVSMGVEATRLAAEGYGEKYPVASNDTEEGRAQNRRIAVRVTKK